MLAMIGVLSLTGVPQAAIIGNSTTVTAEATTRLSVPNGLTSIDKTYAQKIISYSSGKISKSSFAKASSAYRSANESRLKKSNTFSTRSKIIKDSNLLNGLAKKTNSKKRGYITSAVKNATVMPSVSSSSSSSNTKKPSSGSSSALSKKLTISSNLTTAGKAFANTVISRASSKSSASDLQSAADTYHSKIANAVAGRPSLKSRVDQDRKLLQDLAKKTGSSEIVSVVDKATTLSSDNDSSSNSDNNGDSNTGSSTDDNYFDDNSSDSDDDDLTNYGWDNSGSGSSDDWGDFSSDDADDTWNFDD